MMRLVNREDLFLQTNAAAPAVLMALYLDGEKCPVRQMMTVCGQALLRGWLQRHEIAGDQYP